MWEHNYNMLKWKVKYLWNVEISFTFKKNRLVHDFCMFIKVIISNTNDKKNSTKNYRFVKKKKFLYKMENKYTFDCSDIPGMLTTF